MGLTLENLVIVLIAMRTRVKTFSFDEWGCLPFRATEKRKWLKQNGATIIVIIIIEWQTKISKRTYRRCFEEYLIVELLPKLNSNFIPNQRKIDAQTY